MPACNMDPAIVQAYTQILHNELKEALGCTEPIAIAYGAAYATQLLGRLADHFSVHCSGNIIKNVKAVTVPQTGGMAGIEAAVLIGAIGGDADLGMQVLTRVTEEDREKLRACMEKHMVDVNLLDTEHVLHIIVEATAGDDKVSVEIIDSHTQLGTVTKNGEVLHKLETCKVEDNRKLYETLNVTSILDYADQVDLDTVRDVLQRQVDCNLAIAQKGLDEGFGEAVGQTLMGFDGTLYSHCRPPEDLNRQALCVLRRGQRSGRCGLRRGLSRWREHRRHFSDNYQLHRDHRRHGLRWRKIQLRK